MASDNRTIGRFHLDGIPPSPRGVPQIEVSFDIDANGILNVSAKDNASGKEQSIRIEASSGLSEQEIEKMRTDAKAHADDDKKRKEEIEKLNSADALVMQTEKNLSDYGDKLPADKKSRIEAALAEVKKLHEAKDVAGLEPAVEELNAAWADASQEMYAAQQAAGGEDASGDGASAEAEAEPEADAEVKDVDYEVVDDEDEEPAK